MSSDYDDLPRGIYYEKEKLTDEEIKKYKNNFLQYIGELVNYCENDNTPSFITNKPLSTRERLELLAFSILSAIDGESLGTVGFIMIPMINCEDEKYYLPDNIYDYDIAGSLHDNVNKFF